MIFNSLSFIIFFSIFLCVYQFSNQNFRAILIFAFSLTLFALNDGIGLTPLLVSILIDYFIGIKISQASNKSDARIYLILSWTLNLSILAFFKYFNGGTWFYNSQTLPLGISFYTFQTLAYTSSVYRRDIKRESSFLDFSNFVSFFPQLIMGPIESYQKLMPQLKLLKDIRKNRILLGLQIFLFGVFKKQVIADRVAPFVTKVYDNLHLFDFYLIAIATVCFGYQLYCDFSGYMDMGRGIAKMLNIRLTINFRAPFFACSLQDFWRRWHISLLNWFKQNVYSLFRPYLSRGLTVLFVFILSGAWHGAGLNFILWGFLHGVLLILYQIIKPIREVILMSFKNIGTPFLTLYHIFCVILTFSVVVAITFLLRVNSVKDIFFWINNLGDHLFSITDLKKIVSENFMFHFGVTFVDISIFLIGSLILILCDFFLFESRIRFSLIKKLIMNPGVPIVLLLLVIIFFSNSTREVFYYFRF